MFFHPIARVLLGAFIISFSGIWVQLAGVAPEISAFYRVFWGGIFLLPACWYRGELRQRPRAGQVGWALVCGLFFALDLYCWHASIREIGPGLATILGNFQVFILAAVGILFFGEKVQLRFLLAIPTALLGLLCIIGFDWRMLSPAYKTGIFYGLATAVCYSSFLLILRKLQVAGESFSFFFNLMLISWASALCFSLPILLHGHSFLLPNLSSFCELVCLGLLSQAVGWPLIANSMPQIKASTVGFILLVQPALAFVWDVVFFDRPSTFWNWLGVGIILGAFYVGMRSKAVKMK